MLDRLNAEISIHHQVKHPNIVELLNCFCDDKYVYLILELCSNGDLEHYLQEKKTLSEHESKQQSIEFHFVFSEIFFQLEISANKWSMVSSIYTVMEFYIEISNYRIYCSLTLSMW